MANLYDSMPSTLTLQQLLVQAGFLPQAEPACFQAGLVHVRVLDAPRLLVQAPSGTHYLAVLSEDHFAQVLAELGRPLPARSASPKSCGCTTPRELP